MMDVQTGTAQPVATHRPPSAVRSAAAPQQPLTVSATA